MYENQGVVPLKLENLEKIRRNGMKNVHVPNFDPNEVSIGMLHIGVGGFHRAHQAYYTQKVIEEDFESSKHWGICGIGLLDSDEVIQSKLKSQDFLYSILQPSSNDNNDEYKLTIIASLKNMLLLTKDSEREQILKLALSPEIRIISLTITEKGYLMDIPSQILIDSHPVIQHDLQNPQNPKSALGFLSFVIESRRIQQLSGLTLISCDNIPLNGHVLKAGIKAFGRLVYGDQFIEYIESHCSFPSTMVDGITPIAEQFHVDLIANRFEILDQAVTVCEEWQQWCIEDVKFACGRPNWDTIQNGYAAQVVTNVADYENTKICLLNVPHSALAYGGGWMLGKETMDEAMRDENVIRLFKI